MDAETKQESDLQTQYIYLIDDNGFIIGANLLFSGRNIPHNAVIIPTPSDIIKPKWNGGEWIEGETAEERAERESQQLLESLKPSPEEIANAELEIKMLTMLTDLGVIQ